MQSILALFAFVLTVVGGYGLLNQPAQEPPWTREIPGFAFSPYQAGESPLTQQHPSEAAIAQDLALLAGQTRAIRTYTVAGVFAEVPRLAQMHNIQVAVGAWLSNDVAANQQEIQRLQSLLAQKPSNVVRVIVGNEALLRKELSPAQLQAYIQHIQRNTTLPVSTAEPWHVWLKHPELAAQVDYLAVHLLPYWEGIHLDKAVDFALASHRELRKAYPNKPIVITEVGWPSHGRSIKQAVASGANQAKFLRRFVHRAQQEGLAYYVMEAFDQPWKSSLEGSVGGHWGVFDIHRRPKFERENPVQAIPEWKWLASASALAGVLLVALLMRDSARLQTRGRTFLMFNAFAASCLLVVALYDFWLQYHTLTSAVVSLLLLVGMVGVFAMVLTEAHEWAEAMWSHYRKRLLKPKPRHSGLALAHTPKVSIHVPAYDEPPELLMETLNALAALRYPNFEVIVVDNNTPKASTWRPVQAHCERLGPRFRFVHVKPLEGYKAGALNLALKLTAPDAEVVAVIDADYTVHPNWLRDLVPEFAKANVAIVQAPQDYRDGQDNAFKAYCHAEYRGFFQLGMITRNERNAIIQHGTMTMVRRKALEAVGGWGTSTVTEDSELGLRLFEAGHEALYINHSYGRGLMPDTFLDYKKQRHRWAYGAMQILRQHARALWGLQPSALSLGQRYHFVSGWLPWVADGLNLVLAALVVVWSALMMLDPLAYNAPPLLISAVPLLFFAFRLSKQFTLYLGQVKTGLPTALRAVIAGAALSYTIGRASLAGLLLGRDIPFVRTPKRAEQAAWRTALMHARDETVLACALTLASFVLMAVLGVDSRENLLWCIMLLCQSLPYWAALGLSLVSAQPNASGAQATTPSTP